MYPAILFPQQYNIFLKYKILCSTQYSQETTGLILRA